MTGQPWKPTSQRIVPDPAAGGPKLAAPLVVVLVALLLCGCRDPSSPLLRIMEREGGGFSVELPIFWAADPAAHVWADGKLWIYATTDSRDWASVTRYHAWSFSGSGSWTKHEEIFSAEECSWCTHHAWAPDAAYRDGKYYFYYYFYNEGHPVRGIGVAVADSPAGPFRNATPDEPLVFGHDPCVFIDDDGQAYLYEQNQAYFLADDMISFRREDGRPMVRTVEFVGHQPQGKWEAAWVFERGGTYYYSFVDEDARQIRYFMGDSPTGPFHYAGPLLHRFPRPVHHSIVEYRGEWILWYHTWYDGGAGQRGVHALPVTFDAQGRIRPTG
jgi:hypothetical protein